MDIAKNFQLFTDCVYFPLDKPCVYQKNNSAHCVDCGKYLKASDCAENKILIIKLGAMGDVLRTTFLLQGLKEIFPKSVIHWLVDKKNSAVLENNKFIDKIIAMSENISEYLADNFFDAVINLDLSPTSLALTKLSSKKKVLGYSLDDNRKIAASNSYADQWLKLSAYDELKKKNTFTYQHWMSKIAEIPKDNYEIVVPLNKISVEKAAAFLNKFHIDTAKKIIGINPGAGKRWQMKKWKTDNFAAVAKYFSNKGRSILLLGGTADEEEINKILKENIKNTISCGTNNSIPDFFAFVNLCDIIICGDTMALHAAVGLKKNVVALFGPTSLSEIEIYGRGIKIQSDKECLCCYRQKCDISDNCMEKISPNMVIDSVEKLL